jgi:hypothetical protein
VFWVFRGSSVLDWSVLVRVETVPGGTDGSSDRVSLAAFHAHREWPVLVSGRTTMRELLESMVMRLALLA